MDWLVIYYALGPGLFGFSLAYLVRRPDDWSGPAIVLPLSALLMALTHYWGYCKFERDADVVVLETRLSRYGGLGVGLVVFVMGCFWLLN